MPSKSNYRKTGHFAVIWPKPETDSYYRFQGQFEVEIRVEFEIVLLKSLIFGQKYEFKSEMCHFRTENCAFSNQISFFELKILSHSSY